MKLFLINCAKNNLGDLLMAVSVVDHFYEHGIRDIRLNGRPLDPKDDLQFEAGLKNLKRCPFFGARLGIQKLLRNQEGTKLLQVEGVEENDLVFDVNGYRHGGVHGSANIRDDLKLLRFCKERGATIVHMPKSYGPFRGTDHDAVCEMINYVDLAFPRDKYAFTHLTAITGSNDRKIIMSPDHSAYSNRHQTYQSEQFHNQVLIVPNNKLVEVGIFGSQAAYFDRLVEIYGAFREIGVKSTVLFHTQLDFDLYSKRCEENSVPIFYSRNPFFVKRIIGSASFMVTSRYHAMINALTQQVPCAVLAWSEKYAGFLDYFDLSEEIIFSETERRGASVLEIYNRRSDFLERMAIGRERIGSMTEELWKTIEVTIQPSSSAVEWR